MQLDPEVKQELEETFIFKSLLGQGSFGCVYQCQDRRDNQIYAVKIISKSDVKKSKIQCLRQQARLLSSINHPNIVKVYEFVQTNTYIFLRMEIIRNGTLEKLIKERWGSGKKFTDDEMALIMSSLFRTISYIHSMNIIHRDIKPENILIPSYDDLSKIKMADFGLSTKLDFFYPKTATSKCGTMLYMAPQILNNLSYTKSVDIWSCSIIMYMLFQGKHPFFQSKMTTDDYKRKIKNVVFPPLNNAMAQDFISRISKVQANQRYTTQQALNHPWLTRNFDDQIPQSLHESFQGFQKSHTISNIFKLLITTKMLCQGSAIPPVPQSYILKKQQQSTQFLSLNLKKVKSRKMLQKEKSTLSNSSKISTIQAEKQFKQPQDIIQNKQNTPAIAKLNAIFDTLLQRKPRTKDKKLNQNYLNIKIKKDQRPQEESPPQQLFFKQKLQNEIEKLVRQFKGEETFRTSNQTGIKRMLPANKRKNGEKDKYTTEKDDFRISIESINSASSGSLFKIRHRKKNGVAAALKLYC